MSSPSEGHILSRLQIAKHGRDRYPTAARNALKLISEATELAEAIDEDPPEPCDMVSPEIRRELADTGLALFALADKLGLDLIEVMRDLVDADTRSFT